MKKMKKFFALLIAVAMVTVMSMSVMAGTIVVESGTSASDGTTSQDVLEGETYTAYKILNYTDNSYTVTDEETGETTTVAATAYSYYLTAEQYSAAEDGTAAEDGLGALLEGAGFEFEVSADGTQYYVSNTDDIDDAAAVAKYLYTNKAKLANLAIASATATAEADKEAVFTDLATGYWFVTSSLGALCSLQSYDDEALIVEKNETLPPPKKEVSDTEAQVGDVLTYTVTLTDVKGTNLEAIIEDTMSKGLTYNKDATLVATIAGTDAEGNATSTESTLAEGTNYTESVVTAEDGSTVVTWTISADQMTAMETNDTIVVTYTATVNTAASIDGTELNTALIRYSKQETDGTEIEVETTWLKIDKTDGTNALKGAQFELYREVTETTTDEEGNESSTTSQVAVNITEMTEAEIAEALGTDAEGNQIEAAADTVYYKVDNASTSNVIDMTDASSAVVYGLDKDSTYYLTETVAPDGYNLLDEQVKVVLATQNDIDVKNEAGTVLPSTGGIGTTIFYIVGAMLVIGAGVVLVTRRRMDA